MRYWVKSTEKNIPTAKRNRGSNIMPFKVVLLEVVSWETLGFFMFFFVLFFLNRSTWLNNTSVVQLAWSPGSLFDQKISGKVGQGFKNSLYDDEGKHLTSYFSFSADFPFYHNVLCLTIISNGEENHEKSNLKGRNNLRITEQSRRSSYALCKAQHVYAT